MYERKMNQLKIKLPILFVYEAASQSSRLPAFGAIFNHQNVFGERIIHPHCCEQLHSCSV